MRRVGSWWLQWYELVNGEGWILTAKFVVSEWRRLGLVGCNGLGWWMGRVGLDCKVVGCWMGRIGSWWLQWLGLVDGEGWVLVPAMGKVLMAAMGCVSEWGGLSFGGCSVLGCWMRRVVSWWLQWFGFMIGGGGGGVCLGGCNALGWMRRVGFWRLQWFGLVNEEDWVLVAAMDWIVEMGGGGGGSWWLIWVGFVNVDGCVLVAVGLLNVEGWVLVAAMGWVREWGWLCLGSCSS